MKFIYRYSTGLAAISLMLPASAATVYSNLQNIAIPADFDGVYLNLNPSSGSYIVTTPNDAGTNWDMNAYFGYDGGPVVATTPTLQPVRTAASDSAALANLAVGATVNVSSLYYDATYGGTGFGISDTHLGTTFTAGAEGYIGFKLDLNNSSPASPLWSYGWMRVTFTDSTGSAVIKDWAYDNSGAAIVVGRVQESVVDGTHNLVTLSPQGSESFTLSSVLANSSGSITDSVLKTGAGTTILSATNTYSGSTTVTGGTLGLDYSTNNTSKLSDSAALVLGGGTVNLTGGSHTEVVLSTTINAGASAVTRASGTAVLELNTITRNAGGTIDFGAGSIATTDTTNTNGILGPWATINGSDWAKNSTNGADGPITAYTAYTDVTRLSSGTKVISDGSSSNVRIVDGTGTAANITLGASTTTSTTTINTLNQSATGGTVTIDPAGQTLAVNGILVGSGASGLTIGNGTNNGTLMSATAGGELVLSNFSTNGLTINSVVANNSSATALTKSGTGTVTLNGSNTYSGNTTINAGTLALGASASIANSPVINVQAGATLNVSAVTGGWTVQGSGTSARQTLTGSGGVTGATTIGSYGTHAPGGVGVVGTQSFSGDLHYASGSIFAWDLNANSTSMGFDMVGAGGAISVDTTSTVFQVVFGTDVNLSNAFWSTPYITQTWSMASIFGQAFASGYFGSVEVVGRDMTHVGSFSINGTNLTFTAVPEPTGALAGLLLAAGLLRRRR